MPDHEKPIRALIEWWAEAVRGGDKRGVVADHAGTGQFDDDPGVAYDEDLANRIRGLIASEPGVSEQTMFGGLAFLVGGNMSVAASGQGGLMVRVDPEETDVLLGKPHAQPFEMRGGQCRAGCASTPRACEPTGSSNPG